MRPPGLIVKQLRKPPQPAILERMNDLTPDETPVITLFDLLAIFAENLSAAPPEYVHGLSAETDQVVQALTSPLKGRVVVLGPNRVGKSALIHAVTARMRHYRINDREPQVWRLTPSNLPGVGTSGSWQNALELMFAAWRQHPEVILYFDELPRAAHLGQSGDPDSDMDMATWLAAALHRQPGLCLAEAESQAWQRFVDKYPAYAQLFLPVRLTEPAPAEALTVIQAVLPYWEQGENVSAEAVHQAFDLSQRYLLDRAQPGKSFDLLRDALAVTDPATPLSRDHVLQRFAAQSGLPFMLLDDRAPFDEEAMLRFFRSRVLAQDQAVEAIVRAISLLRARLNNPLRPMGVFLFLGPTGVGKTELAHALAEYLFGNRDRLVRFNMADYADPFAASAELFGNPHASELTYRRGLLTNRLAGRAFSVLVLDEFEKAHPLIYQRFLQLFDEGLLINGNDDTVNLRNTIIIITSNFGAQMVEHSQLGFRPNETSESREKRVIAETERYFTPEFMNRIDAVCIFHPLARTVMADIARREIGDLLKRDGLQRRRLEVDIADEVIDHVVSMGYSPSYGARFLKRQIEKTITYPLARELNRLPFDEHGGTVRLYLKHGRVASAYLPPQPPPPAETAPARDALTGLTLADLRAAWPVLAARVEALEERYGVASAQETQAAILGDMAEVTFWQDAARARRKLDQYQQAANTVETLAGVRRALDQLAAALAAVSPTLATALPPYKTLIHELPRLEFTAWLSGPYDTHSAYVLITSRHKHPSARRWVADLAEMYLGWARRRRLSATVLGEETSPDGRAFTLALALSGFGVYGLLSGETGAHRLTQLVKVNGAEQTQRLVATVQVFPELDDDELPALPAEVTVRAKSINRPGAYLKHLSTQVSLSGGPLTLTLASHLPADDLQAELLRLAGAHAALTANPQILPPAPPGGLVRAYTRHTKDKGVHDYRTGLRSAKIKAVLDGDLQAFLDAYLQTRAAAPTTDH